MLTLIFLSTGTTSPIQLLFMTLVEIILLNVNEVAEMVIMMMAMLMEMIVKPIVFMLMMMMTKVIGRNLLGAVDVGDCIFSHMFGAYFGLSISKVFFSNLYFTEQHFSSVFRCQAFVTLPSPSQVLYNKNASKSTKAGATRTSDLFSMVSMMIMMMPLTMVSGKAI